MQTIAVGELESRFSEVIDIVKKGGEVFLTFEDSKKVIGQFIPILEKKKGKRKLGIWKDEMNVSWKGDGKMTLEEFFGEE